VTVELQGQLLAWDRELDSREGAIVTMEKGLVPVAHELEKVPVECDANRARADAIQWDFFTHVHASSS
jgi:hypothetical protein